MPRSLSKGELKLWGILGGSETGSDAAVFGSGAAGSAGCAAAGSEGEAVSENGRAGIRRWAAATRISSFAWGPAVECETIAGEARSAELAKRFGSDRGHPAEASLLKVLLKT